MANILQSLKKNIETRLIWLICLFLALISICIISIYFHNILSMYSEQLLQSNERVLEQVIIAYESVTKQTTDSIYKIPLYDKELLNLIRGYNTDAFYRYNIITKLNSLILGNEYLFSACLYLPRHDIIYDANSGAASSRESFFDKNVLKGVDGGKIYILDPRWIEAYGQKKILMAVVCPIPIPATAKGFEGFLIVYIDARKLYYNILKKIQAQDNMVCFVYNRENSIIMHKNEDLLFKSVQLKNLPPNDSSQITNSGGIFKMRMSITSRRYSKPLKWNFVMEKKVETPVNYLMRLYTFLLYFVVILLIGLMVMIYIVKKSVKPIHTLMINYHETFWKNYLTDNNNDSEETKRLLSSEKFNPEGEYSGVVVFQITKQNQLSINIRQCMERFIATHPTAEIFTGIKIIAVNKYQLALIIYSKKEATVLKSENKLLSFIYQFCDSLNPDTRMETYVSVSMPKDNLNLLPIAYMECMESLNYKICFNSRVIFYSGLKEKPLWSDYPYDIERQVVNNVIVGNLEASKILVEKFFQSLLRPENRIQDGELKNCLYQLQAAILRSITEFPVHYRSDTSVDILALFDQELIKKEMMNFVGNMALEMGKKDGNEEHILYQRIMKYIDTHYMHEDFNLNRAADELKLNRNYLSKFIKEHTGEHFNDYMQIKRILAAKQLMRDTDEPIENISHQVGFNYSHYFIRVFKKIEGITPGQYREKFKRSVN